MRLATVERVEHEGVFEAFAQTIAAQVLEERVRREPRVVSLREKRGRL